MNRLTYLVKTFFSTAILFLVLAVQAKAQTYCTPFFYYGDYYGSQHEYSIVTTGGTTNLNWAPGNTGTTPVSPTVGYPSTYGQAGEGYAYITSTSVSAGPGTTINWTIVTNANNTSYVGSSYHYMWIDWNNNGLFDPNENVYTSASPTSGQVTLTGSFTVPTTAAPGIHRFRTMTGYYGYFQSYASSTYPCFNWNVQSLAYYGNSLDFNFIVTQPCSVTPQPCVVSNPPAGTQCAGYGMTLNATDPNLGYIGIGYQWQTSSSISGPWTNIPGANSLSYTTPPLVGSTYYRITDTCYNVSANSAASVVYPIGITGYSIPYVQNFDFPSNPGLVNFGIPACMQRNGAAGLLDTIFYQGFDGTTFPPTGWTSTIWGGSYNWARNTGSQGTPAESPHSGAGAAWFNNWYQPYPGGATMCTPAINMSTQPIGANATLSFWFFKYTGAYGYDSMSVYLNTQPNLTSGQPYLLAQLAQYYLYPPVVSTTGWYQYSYTIPASWNSSTAMYILFKDFSWYGYDIYVDDIVVTTPLTTKWGQLGPNTFKASDGTILPWCVYATDTAGNVNGKTDYITTPDLPLTQGITYRVRFGYAVGKSNCFTNTGTTPNNESLYLMVGTSNPGSNSPTVPLSNFPGSQVWSGIASNTGPSYTPTTANFITYSAPATGGYFFTWIDNTPHTPPASVPNGTVALDSIRIDSVGCVLASIVNQPVVSTSVCAGFPVSFSVTSAGYGLTYQWYKGSTLIPGATASTYTIASPQLADAGSYNVHVMSACGIGNTVISNNATLVVNPSPPAAVTAGGPTTICPNTFVPLNGTPGSYGRQWLINGNVINGANSANYSAGLSGIYTLIDTGAGGCYTVSNPVTVNVLPAPPALITASGSTTLCNGNCVTLSANTGTNYSYQWQNNTANIPGATGDSLLVCTAGSYTVTVTGGNGCFSTTPIPVNVIVNPLPPAVVTASGPDTFCLNQSVTLVSPLNSGVVYQWFDSANAISNQTTNTYIATNSGLYKLKVTYTATSCYSYSPISTVLMNTPSASISAPTTSLCAGNTVTLTANAGPAQGTFSYQWNANGYPIPGATAPTYVVSIAGSYTVTITATAGGYACSQTSQPIVLQAYAAPPAFIVAAGPTTFCAGNTVTLNADTGTGYTYQWALNGVSIPAATTVSYAAPLSGSYTVKVTNQYGCFGTSPATVVTVIPLPTPVITPSGSTQLCPGGSVTLSTATGPGLSYQWYNGAVPITGATFPNYVASATAVYTVQVTNSTNCVGMSSPISVVMNPLPSSSISATGPTNICAGSSVTLSAVAVAGNTYQWMLNGQVISGAVSNTYTTTTAGAYTVKVTSSVGCISSAANTINVTVYTLPTASITSTGPTSVCTGDSVNLAANLGANLTYQWNDNAAAIGGATSSTFVAHTTGNYTVTVTDGNGCVNTSSSTLISIYPVPLAAMVPAADTGFCQGSSVVLTATSGSGYTYQWKLNGTNIPGAVNNTYQAAQVGTYTVLVTANICSALSPTKNVSVYPLPVDTAHLSGTDKICIGDSAKITAQSGNGYTYQWMQNGATISGANTNVYYVKDSGAFTVMVTNNYGCATTTQAINISLFPAPNPLIIPYGNSLTTGGFVHYQWYKGGTATSNLIPGATSSSYQATSNGYYYVFVTDSNGCSAFSQVYIIGPAGVTNVNGQNGVKIYPNPATSVINIQAAVSVKVRISDLEGRILIDQNQPKTIDISGLANGVYMISVYDQQNNLLKVERLVKSSW